MKIYSCTAGNFKRALLLPLLVIGLNSASAQGLVIEGNALSNRTFNTDQASNVQFVLDFPITQAGTLQSILAWGENTGQGIPGLGQSFYAYVVRPAGPSTYQVLMKTDILTVSNAGTNTFAIPPFSVQVGDWIAHYGGGIPLSINTGGPSSIYGVTNENDVPLPMPVVGTSVELPGPIYILYDDGGRNYAISAAVSLLPNLTIAQAGNTVTISWPATGASTLLQTTNLAVGNWTTNTSFSSANGTNSLAITGPVGNLFFQLRNP